jgi:hypothetical protein
MSLHQNHNVKEPHFTDPVAKVIAVSIREVRNGPSR